MENISRKLQRIQKLQARISMIVGEIEKDLECLGFNQTETKQNSPASDPERNVATTRYTEEDWSLDAHQPPFSLMSGPSKQNRSWEKKCPACYSINCGH